MEHALCVPVGDFATVRGPFFETEWVIGLGNEGESLELLNHEMVSLAELLLRPSEDLKALSDAIVDALKQSEE